MELATFGRALRKNWWLVALFVVVFTGGATAYVSSLTPQYSTTLSVFVRTDPTTNDTKNPVPPQNYQLYDQQLVASLVRAMGSTSVAMAVLADKSVPGIVDLSADDLSKEITASQQLSTVIMDIAITDPDKSRSNLVARKLSAALPAVIASLGGSSAIATTTVYSLGPPETASGPVSPRKPLYIGLGLMIGIALGLAAAFLRELLNKSLRTAEDVRAIGMSPVGAVNYTRSARRAPLIVSDDPAHPERAEEYRKIRTNLRFAGVSNPLRAISVASAIAGEGKSTTAANLAIVLAEGGREVLLVEADLRRPRMSQYLDLEPSFGLTNVLVGEAALGDAVQRWGDGISVLTCGTVPPNPSELLASDAMRDLMTLMRERYEVIVIDTPPLGPVTDGAMVAAHCDGTLVVVRHGKTSSDRVSAAVDTIAAVDGRVVGVVLNMRKDRRARKDNRYRTLAPETSPVRRSVPHSDDKYPHEDESGVDILTSSAALTKSRPGVAPSTSGATSPGAGASSRPADLDHAGIDGAYPDDVDSNESHAERGAAHRR